MAISKEILSDYKEVYEKAVKLVNEESQNDPPTNPFLSHYAAKDLLLGLRENLKILEILETDDCQDDLTYKILLSYVNRDLGRIYVFTEEVTVGEQCFKACIELIESHKMHAGAIIPYVGALNELSLVFANSHRYKEALDMLNSAEKAYHEFKNKGEAAMAITDVFGTPEEIEPGKGNEELEKLYTLCMFYLAQVYRNLNELGKSATYCHKTLRRQMDLKSYEPIDFALNAATLSQYFLQQSMFKEARHHLAVATYVMAEYESKMITPDMSESNVAEVKETFKHRHADLARCWAKYGLALLSASRERLYNDEEEKVANDTKRLSIEPNDFRFPNLQLEEYENRISTDYCLVFEDAKQIFHLVINWLDQAKDYYKLDSEASEYAKIIKDYAELYKNMAFFEENPLNQAKMQKKRAKYYEELIEALNPTYYMAICRECWYAAGLAYCALLDIFLDEPNPSPQLLEKINQVCNKAIKHFSDFQKSYMENDGITLKPNLDIEETRSVLYSHFHLGRLYFKLKMTDLSQQLQNMENSYKHYKLFTEECDKHKEAAEALKAEIGVSKELVNLLPLKMINIKKRLKM